MAATASLLATLVQQTHKPEAEVITMALQVGLRQLWTPLQPENAV